MSQRPDPNQARRLIAGALGDFLTYLTKVTDPILVGGQYSPTRLLRTYQEWCQTRGFDPTDPDPTSWLQLCSGGYMRRTPEGPETPLQGLEGPGRKKTTPKPEPPKQPPKSLDAGNKLDMDQGPYKDDRPKGHRKQPWEDEGEDWKKGKQDG